MTLEIRAGRPLRDALHNLAERLKIEEAKTLAILFKQSEALGTSLTQTLRVYSAEMRERRIIKAEEKANALPVKMVLPLGFCVFPVMLVVVLMPVWIRLADVFFKPRGWEAANEDLEFNGLCCGACDCLSVAGLQCGGRHQLHVVR